MLRQVYNVVQDTLESVGQWHRIEFMDCRHGQ